MLINRNRKALLRLILANDVLVEEIPDLLRFWNGGPGRCGLVLLVVIDYLVTDIDALVANVNAGAGDQFTNVILRLAAKRAAEEFFGSAELSHIFSGQLAAAVGSIRMSTSCLL
jgi:hypothetical protein